MTVLSVSVLALMALWIAVSPRVAPTLYHRFLFHPHKEMGEASEIEKLITTYGGAEHFYRTKAGHTLHAFSLGEFAEKRPVLFYSMGKNGDIPRRAEILAQLLKLQLTVFIYEYRGFGRSQGQPSLPGIIEDARESYDFLHETLNVEAERIVFFGESLGGAVTAQLAGSRKAAAVITKSTFASLNQIARHQFPLLRLYPGSLMLCPDWDNGKALSEVSAPTLIVHGEKDRMIPVDHARQIQAVCSHCSQLLLLPEARHSFMSEADSECLAAGLTAFLKELN
ncbi:MAG: alpha/beta hydrolase [Candidatus Obscuribacter sp.]|nr:alpha/beta hydrolase [Candidatus Obscuribacter sp.]MBK9282486.1 alpha/beta hydrolase [Candidatus Obscuribacter sp.]